MFLTTHKDYMHPVNLVLNTFPESECKIKDAYSKDTLGTMMFIKKINLVCLKWLEFTCRQNPVS